MITRTLSILFVAVLAMAITLPATALPVTVQYDDATTCDPLEDGKDVHELGLGGLSSFFSPLDEEITAFAFTTNLIACQGSDLPGVANVLVEMTNFSGIDWRKVWYVADIGSPLDTTISNIDGTVNAGQAFLIDSVGLNKPLIFESAGTNNIFEAGETWRFIIDDYVNGFGGAASFFTSVGLVGLGSTVALDPTSSTGSIIAVAVPEPATCMLLLIGLGAVVAGRRS